MVRGIGSERQLDDVAGILRTGSLDLDRQYLETWIQRLDLQDQWSRVRERVESK